MLRDEAGWCGSASIGAECLQVNRPGHHEISRASWGGMSQCKVFSSIMAGPIIHTEASSEPSHRR